MTWLAKQRALETLAFREYQAQKAAHKRKTGFRFHPPQWLRDCVEALGRDDLETVSRILCFDYHVEKLRTGRGAGL